MDLANRACRRPMPRARCINEVSSKSPTNAQQRNAEIRYGTPTPAARCENTSAPLAPNQPAWRENTAIGSTMSVRLTDSPATAMTK